MPQMDSSLYVPIISSLYVSFSIFYMLIYVFLFNKNISIMNVKYLFIKYILYYAMLLRSKIF